MSIPDQAQRTHALTTDSSFIVQAPAGSGKTELLTQRFLKLLAQVERPEQILAITFTRKATQEMRERIVGRLRQAARGEQADAAHEQEALAWAKAAMAQDRRLGWRLLDYPNRLQIHTIDGLCARISMASGSAGPHLSGLRVVDDAKPFYQKAAQRLIEDLGHPDAYPDQYRAMERTLVYMRTGAAQLTALVTDMLGRRDQWLDHLTDNAAQRQHTLHLLQIQASETLAAQLGAETIEQAVAVLKALAGYADDANAAQAQVVNQQPSAATEEHDQEVSDSADWWQFLRHLAGSSGNIYKPRSANRFILPGSDDRRAPLIASLQPILVQWHENPEAIEALQNFLKAPPLDINPEQEQALADFSVLLRFATAELQVLFAEQGCTDFIYVAEMAKAALGEEEQPGDVLLSADARLQHILMDEFQDTSHIQFDLLSRLIAGWQSGDGRSLFLVGDPMQSIYRFRKADVSLFERVREQASVGPVALEAVQLSANFRSRSELLNWLNYRFPEIFLPASKTSPGAVSYAPVVPQRGSGGLLSFQPWPYAAGPQHEAELVAKQVAQSLAEGADEVAVLARARKHLTAIAGALRVAGIPFEAIRVECLAQQQVCLDLLSLTRAICHPVDRIAWLSLLRAPWCALDVGELHLVAGTNPSASLSQRMGDASVLDLLEEESAQRVRQVQQVMACAQQQRSDTRLARIVERCWIQLGGPACAESNVDRENAARYLALLSQLEDEAADQLLETLSERMNELYAASAPAKVKLMTIHQAKGLEFDTVIIPGMHRKGRGSDPALMRIQEFAWIDDQAVLMAPINKKGSQQLTLYDYLAVLDKQQSEYELQRLLYVAVTRAKRGLHLFGAWKARAKSEELYCEKHSLMEMLWPEFEHHIDADEVVPVEETADIVHLPLLRLRDHERQFQQPSLVPEVPPVELTEWPDRNATALGQSLHQMLQWAHDVWQSIGQRPVQAPEAELLESLLCSNGAATEDATGLASKLVRLYQAVLDDPAALEVLRPDNKQGSWAERLYFSREDQQLRSHIIDRLFRDADGQFHIYDYKTGAPSGDIQEQWRKQLQRYQTLVIATEGERRSVHSAVLSIQDDVHITGIADMTNEIDNY